MSQTTIETARPVRLHYDLEDLRALRENNWEPNSIGYRITLSAQDSTGNRIAITTNGSGEGLFSEDGTTQRTGTCQFSIRGWSDRKARAELRRRYDEMMETRQLNAELAQFEDEFAAECGIEED